mgnify:CR=1 FL=1
MKFYVQIEEVLSRLVSVEAQDEDEAICKVEELYRNSKIVLDYSDFCGEPFIDCKGTNIDNPELEHLVKEEYNL